MGVVPLSVKESFSAAFCWHAAVKRSKQEKGKIRRFIQAPPFLLECDKYERFFLSNDGFMDVVMVC
jgi:hypothetical protein